MIFSEAKVLQVRAITQLLEGHRPCQSDGVSGKGCGSCLSFPYSKLYEHET